VKGTWQTTDSGGGSGGVALAVIAAVVLIGGAGSAIASALVTFAITAAAVITVAVLAAAALLVYRTRSERPGRPIAAPAVSPLPPVQRPQLEEPSKPAIEAPRREVHLHLNVTPGELAAIMRHYTEEG
jgi:hypothetical protein